MENSRPNHTITLPLKSGSASTITCTIKPPALKLKRKVHELTVKSIALSEECVEHLKRTKPANETLAAALGTPVETKARADRDAIVKKIDELNGEQYAIEIAQLQLIVNIPNDGDRKRSHDDIDWEEIPEDELKEAIVFFANGPKS